MFDGSLPEIGDLAALDDAALVDAAAGWARTENAACARKTAVMAELFARRTGLPAGERELWWVDPQAAVGAELGATQNISTWMALAQAHRGVVLADRLPTIASLFEAGLISEMLVRAIEYRTALVTDEAAIARVDALLAAAVMAWGPLSARKVEQAIDAIVDEVDPGALRRSRKATCDRDVQFGSPSDEAGFTSMWARMYAPDAVVLEQRVEEMARSVCEDDPRTLGERRSEALTAIAAGITELACDCGGTDCPAAGRDASTPAGAVIHVVAHADTVEAATAAPADDVPPPPPAPVESDGEAATPQVEPASTARRGQVPPAFCPAPAAAGAATTPASCSVPPAFVIGAGVMPAPLLAATMGRATVREIRHPGDAPPEPRYTPSRALADFVRCRDLTCRWPGCDKPAYDCDIDHTVPWPAGPTHASNLKCYCRFHHLLKTFYCGVGGWRERQLPDGTLILTAPTGHTYTTKPGCAQLFPTLCQPTGELHLPAYQPTRGSDDRGAMMPKRRRTRAENLARRIQAERRLNDDYIAERNKPPPFSQNIAHQAILPAVQLSSTLVRMTAILGLRERKKLGTRWALSDAALELAMERGLENVTREDIANRAGVSLRTFNNYFTGKYEAVAFRQVDRTRQSLEAFRERPADEPLWTAITEAMLQPLEAEGAADIRPTPGELAVVRELLSARDLRAALTRDLMADWVDAIAERTGTDPARDMYPRLVTAVVRAVGETAMEAYSYADPPVAYTELLRRGLADVAAGLPER